MKVFFTCILGCFFGSLLVNTVTAQTFIYYQYQAVIQKDTVHHFALLTILPDGTANAKILFEAPETHEQHMVSCALFEKVDTVLKEQDTTLEISLVTSSFNFERGNPTTRFEKPQFVFTTNHDDSITVHDPTEIRYLENTDAFLALDSVKVLTYDDLSREFVELFYADTDPVFKSIFSLNNKSLTSFDRQAKLYLIAVAQVKDSIIGETCALDLKRITNQFSLITQFLGIQMITRIISESNYSKANVEGALRSLNPNTNDIVVFYYSGHGFRIDSDKRKFPYIDLTINKEQDYKVHSMNIEDIYQTIVNKKARLNIVLSDCCNAGFGTTNVVGPAALSTRSSGPAYGIDNLKALFFNPRQTSILFTSADIGQLASGNPDMGGYFSFYFLSTLNESIRRGSPIVSWPKIFTDTRTKTYSKALRTNCAPKFQPMTSCVQIPQIKRD